jgi:hypothetical protein
MEAKAYRLLERLLMQLSHPGTKGVVFSDHWIVSVLLWAVLHDRPVCWACVAENWPKQLRRPLPGQSTMSRRLRRVGVLQLIERFLQMLADRFPEPLVKTIDSKPLAVDNYSRDVDAKPGVASGRKMRGYKIHAICGGQDVRHWTLSPMSEHDSKAAARLIPLLARSGGAGYLSADNAYDSNDLHRLAAAANHHLVAPPRKVNAGKRDADPRHNTPQRLHALDLCEDPLACCGRKDSFGRDLRRHRGRVERCFGRLTFGGLSLGLPPWVRGPRRVALWSATKLAIDLCRRAKNKGLMP